MSFCYPCRRLYSICYKSGHYYYYKNYVVVFKKLYIHALPNIALSVVNRIAGNSSAVAFLCQMLETHISSIGLLLCILLACIYHFKFSSAPRSLIQLESTNIECIPLASSIVLVVDLPLFVDSLVEYAKSYDAHSHVVQFYMAMYLICDQLLNVVVGIQILLIISEIICCNNVARFIFAFSRQLETVPD